MEKLCRVPGVAVCVFALLVVMSVSVVVWPGEGKAALAGGESVLFNGDFEEGFYVLWSVPGALFENYGQSIPNGWAPYSLAGHPSFAGERSTLHGGSWAFKVSGFGRFAAGLAQVVKVQPGKTYRVAAQYQLYPPGDGAAFLGVQDGDYPASWVGDGWVGAWRQLSQEVTARTGRFLVSIQGSNAVPYNTNVYFDDVVVSETGGIPHFPPTPTSTPPPAQEGTIPRVIREVDMGLPEGDCYEPNLLSWDDSTGLLYVLGYKYEDTDTPGRSCVSAVDIQAGEVADVVPLPWSSIGPMTAAGGRIYTRFEDENYEDYLAVVDAASGEVLAAEPVESLYSDQDMVVDVEAGRIYLPLFDHVQVRSAADLSPIASVPLEVPLDYNAPSSIATTGGRLYVAQGSRIEVRDGSALTLLDTFDVESGVFYGLDVGDDGTLIYARLKKEGLNYGEFDEELLAFDAATGEIVTRIGPYDGAILGWDEDAGEVYLLSTWYYGRLLRRVDMAGGETRAELKLDYTYETFWDSGRGLLYMPHLERHGVFSVDLAAMQKDEYIPLGIELKDMAIDSSAGRVYVGDTAGRVHVLDRETYEELASLPGQGDLTPDYTNRRLYVSEGYGDEVTVIDLETLEVAGTIPAGGHVAVDEGRNRFFVGNYIGYEGPREGDEGVRVYDGATLTQIGTASMSGIPTYNPLADELYVISMTAYILDVNTLEVTGDLTPDVTEVNRIMPWCNGCKVTTAVKVYPGRNLLAVEVTPLSAGKGAGYYPPYRFLDATTREQITRPVTLEDTCLGELILGPIDGRIYEHRFYSRYVYYSNLVVYDEAGGVVFWMDGIGKPLPNPLTRQIYVYDSGRDDMPVLDMDTMTPVGAMPEYCFHTLDFSADRLYAMESSTLVVLSGSGGQVPTPPPPEPGTLPAHPVWAIHPSPDYAADRTLFVVDDELYRSTDGGENWVKLQGGLPYSQNYEVAISPGYAEDRTLFAAMRTGEWRGDGIYRSVDGGETWQPTWNGLNHLRAYDVVVSPAYPADRTLIAYAVFNNLVEQKQGESVFISTDGAEHWSMVDSKPQGETSNLPKPEDLLPMPDEPVRFNVAEYGGGVGRSADGGQTWETIAVLAQEPDWWENVRDVVKSPAFDGDNTVYVLGGTALYRSTNRGETWQKLRDGRIGERVSDNYLYSIAVSPDAGGRHEVFIGTYVGEVIAISPYLAEWEATDDFVAPPPAGG